MTHYKGIAERLQAQLDAVVKTLEDLDYSYFVAREEGYTDEERQQTEARLMYQLYCLTGARFTDYDGNKYSPHPDLSKATD